MDVTLVLSAIICTLLALVVATSLLSGSAGDFTNARNYFSHRDSSAGGSDWPGPRHNGYFPDKRKKKTAVDDWSDVSGSSHDHWDVVKTVLSEETHQHPHTEGQATAGDHWSSTSSRSVPRPGSSLDVDPSFEASSGRGHRSFIGLSGQDLLKCAFSYPQNEGATENTGNNDKVESKANNFMKYIPGKSQSHHLQTMMSKEELEEEQRVQQEQLAAIFQLLKDNKETFGDVTEGDMEEQLKLYSI